MTAAVFGDLLGPARAQLDAAARFDGDLHRHSVDGAVRAVRRIAHTLSRYLADIASYGMAEAITHPGLDARTRAAVDAREALRMAAASLRTGGAGDGGLGEAAPESLPADLAAAAGALAAGRDLLRTHFGTDSRGWWSESSDWSAVITSGPVTRALLEEVACWSRGLAFVTARLSLATPVDSGLSGPVQQGMIGASHWFLTASSGLVAGQRGDRARAADVELLDAIPVNVIPARVSPQEGEALAGLARGVAVSAARLRMIGWSTAERAVWSPEMTVESWRWGATGAAVVCHVSELVLRALAEHPGLGDRLPDVGARLRAAADSARAAWGSWREVSGAWSGVTTETKGLTAPGIADMGDLILRLGRIAFGDPEWVPARVRGGEVGDPAVLAPDLSQFVSVVSAVHRAVDAVVHVGAADLRGVGMAVRASRLYVLTGSLPDGYDVPYRFGHATRTTTAGLLDLYGMAGDLTGRAVGDLDALAVALRAPSRVLEAARAANRAGPNFRRGREEGRGEAGSATSSVSGPEPPATPPPGPVERTVLRLRAADPFLLLRARTIDKAAHELIADAREAARRRHGTGGGLNHGETSSGANASAQVAAQSFPRTAGVLVCSPSLPSSGQRGTSPARCSEPRPPRGRNPAAPQKLP